MANILLYIGFTLVVISFIVDLWLWFKAGDYTRYVPLRFRFLIGSGFMAYAIKRTRQGDAI